MWTDPSLIDLRLDSRAITPENPTGERGAGGTAERGRKGSPSRLVAAGERIVLADIAGSGTIRHVWLTMELGPPQVMRAVWIEVFYDDLDEPSVAVPALDFFGLPLGRPAPYASQLTTAQEGRGFNAYFPMPFARSVRIELVNGADVPREVYWQVDYTLGPAEPSYLHVSFRRENPTVMGRDFVVVDGLRGPGRFLGCAVGVRALDPGIWWGEGEVKVYRDGDDEWPTICGTGLEDYVGSAWGLGVHHAPFAGAPLEVREPGAALPAYVAFYRWHVPDPIVFATDLRVTIQQLGAMWFTDEAALERFFERQPAAGPGVVRVPAPGGDERHGPWRYGSLTERVDDYSAAAFVYCTTPQPVPALDLAAATADLEPLASEALAWHEHGDGALAG